ncbi:amino acid adenylation domain-containing protein [Rhodococcus sp. HNM0569]|uniref:amino acid adenylation domain-containing protein n=1 Tax=Rhodococcus sp. HNM0569 TaxID=2716340 RepID=UPI003211CC3D
MLHRDAELQAGTVYPATAAQRNIYFGHELDSSGHLYNIGVYTETTGDVDADRLAEVAGQIVARSQPLHVNFEISDAAADGAGTAAASADVVQRVRDDSDWTVPVVDFGHEADPYAASDEWMRARMSRRLDLATDRLFDLAVHRLDADTVRVFQQYHHIVNDGYGIALVIGRIARGYPREQSVDLEPGWTLPVYVAADADYRASEQFAADRAYWLAELADLPQSSTLSRVGPPPGPAQPVILDPMVLDLDRRIPLEQYAREHGMRLTHLLVALAGAYIARITERDEVVLSLPTAARGDRVLRTLPCMASNVVPLRFPVAHGARLAEVADGVVGKLWNAMRHGRYRGEDIGRAIAERTSPAAGAAAPGETAWRPPSIGVNIVPNPTPRNAIGRDTVATPLSWGPVGELEITVVTPNTGDPITVGMRAHPDHVDSAMRYAQGLDAFVDDFLADPDADVWQLGPTSAVDAAAHDAHDTSGVGPLAALPAITAVRESGEAPGDRVHTARLGIPHGGDVVAALDAVLAHHDVLRAQLTAPVPTLWLLDVAPVGTPCAADLVASMDRPDPLARRVLAITGRGATTLDVAGSVTLLDARSWRIVVADLRAALAATAAGRIPELRPVPVSLVARARQFTQAAASPELLAELDEWTHVLEVATPLFADPPYTSSDSETVALAVGRRLVDRAARAAGVSARELYTVVTARALARWTGQTDGEIVVDLHDEGRAAVELSRLAGPLSWTTPVRMPLGGTIDDAVVRVGRRSPGEHWAMLRYANVVAGPTLAALPRPEVLVRIGGDRLTHYALDVHVRPDGSAVELSLAGAPVSRPGAAGRLDELAGHWSAELAAVVDSLAGHVRGLAPADLRHITLTATQIAAVEAAADTELADIWPLSPLQRGLLFQSVFERGRPDSGTIDTDAGDADTSTDIYTAQFTLDFGGRVDVERMRAAAAALAHENPTLRAGFTDAGLDEAVQFVPRAVEVPFTVIDLTDLPAAQQHARAAELAERDRRTPFDLARPPLWRMMLLRTSALDRLVVNREFIVFDGWSGALFVDALLAHYAGDEFARPEAAYTDYLAWLATRDDDATRQQWQRGLADVEPTLLAGSVAGRGAVVPARIESYVDDGLTGALRERARSTGVTLNALMNAATGLLVAAESGRTDVVFGSTVAGRPADVVGLDRVVGMFLNTVPIRVALRPDETVTALLRRMQDEYVDRMDIEYLGLGDIQQATGHTELFDTLFVLQNFKDAARMRAQSERYGIVGEDSLDHTHYPLAVVVSPGERLHVKIDYRTDLVTAARAHALHERFLAVLRFLAHAGDALAVTAPTLTDAEAAAAQDEWSTPLPPVEDVTIAEMLIAKASAVPDEIALVSGDARCTYADLALRVDALARALLGRGVGPEDVVCLGVPRSIDTVVALFAVLRTGAAYLPLELDQPDGRLLTVVDDAAPALFVVTDAVRERLALDENRCLTPDQGAGPALTAAECVPFAPGTPGRLDRPAYVIYTSGSTGKPKGVVTPYRGLTNMQRNHQAAIFGPATAGRGRMRIAHTVSFAFDMSWEELLWLVEGHEVHVCDEDLRRDARALVDYCDAHAIDVVNVTPTYATALFAEGLLTESAHAHRPPLVLLGGEAVADSVWNRLRDTEGTLGYNLYGPTEYTINTLGGGTADSPAPTVGTPIRATRVHILDPWLRPVPDGVAGELYVAGAGLARGYLRRPDLTADRFVADPCARGAETGARMYRTGDLVRRRGDGNIDYLGRVDDQVKIRGYRVELHEIDSVIEGFGTVAAAAVVAVDDPLVPGTKRLAAYVVPADGYVEADVLAHVRAELPDYMVPARLQSVDHLPTTVNGKLDVAALPAPALPSATGGRAAQTPAEHALASIFADVLDVDEVAADADFFELGGHSMIAMRVVSRVRSELDVQLTIRDLFEARTVEGLAQRLPGAAAARPALTPRERPALVPLSAAQERLWTVQQLHGDSLPYHYAHVATVHGHLDPDAFVAAVRDVLTRHESLRTRIDVTDGITHQHVVDADSALDVTVAAAAPDDVRGLVAARLTAPFDLRRDTPLRVAVYRVAETEGPAAATGEPQHVVALVLHHIATDEWSDMPLLRDLTLAYLARARATEPEWAPLPVQYTDYTLWQRALAADGTLDAQLDFWTRELDGLPVETDLPRDRARGERATGAAGHVRLDLAPHTAAGVRALADRAGASVFMVLHAAAAATLGRLGAGEDIAVGSPVSGRSDAALDDLVGFFVDTVVLRTDLGGDPTFAELVERVRDADLRAMEHQDVPFQDVVERLAPPRVEGRNPLFQVMVGYLQRPATTPDFLGLRSEWEPLVSVRAKFDLGLTFVDAPDTGSLTIAAEYAEDLFDESTAYMIVESLTRMLARTVDDAAQRVSDIPLLTDDETRRALGLATGPVREFALAPLGDALTRAAREHAESIALVEDCAGRTLGYRELDAASHRWAHALVARGVRPGDVVAVAIPRSIDQFVAIHAVLKAGAAYLPIDTALPDERIRYLLGDARPLCVLATRGFDASVTSAPVVAVDEPEARAQLDAQPDEPVHTSAGLDHPAYVIYTSGSTGTPKGVVVSHRAVANRLAWVSDARPITQAHTMIAKTPVSFDVSVWELFWPLLSGARVVLAPVDAHRDPHALADVLARRAVTHAHFVPSMLEELLAAAAERPGELEYVACSGEALSVATVARVARQWPGVQVDDLYGPTEAAVEVTRADSVTTGRHGGIGSPGANVTTYVLDTRLRPVPAGVPGELWLGGVQVATGYLGRQVLTAERFVADPFGAPGARLYRTGDIVRVRRDGALDFLGRADDQVKVRGMRIELAEVDAVLESVPGVGRGVAAVHRSPAGPVLVGYVVTADLEPAAVRDALLGRVPDHLVPSVVLGIDRVPVSVHGKLDRKALPAPDFASHESRAPRPGLEADLCALFADSLGRSADEPPVGVDENFFTLGGHSLAAVRLVNAVDSRLGIRLSVRDVFDAPTPELLARVAERAAVSVRPAVRGYERPARLPVSYAQRRMWLVDQLSAAGAAYNVPVSWRVDGVLDDVAFRAALHDVTMRHEALRTRFPVGEDGEPYQDVVEPDDAAVPVEVVSVGGAAGGRAEGAGGRAESAAVAAFVRRPFRLRDEIPIRAALVRADGADSTVVVIVVHHIAIDEWSTPALVEDLAHAFALRQLDRAPEWEPLEVQYADYALWQRAVLGDPADPQSTARRQLDHWRADLAGIPDELALPYDRARPARSTFAGDAAPIVVPAEVVTRLRTVASETGTSMFMLVQAAVAVLLQRFGAGTDIPLGTPVSGRTDAAFERLVGFFLNTLVLRTDLSDDPTLRELLARVRATDLAAFDNQDVPFDHVVDAVSADADDRPGPAHPLFQVMVVYLTQPGPDRFDGAAPYPVAAQTSKFDLSFDFVEFAGTDTVVGLLEYSTELFDRATAERLAAGVVAVLSAFAREPLERAVAALDVHLGTEPAHLALPDPSDAGGDGVATTLPDLLDDAVARFGERAASVAGEHRITFAEFGARVHRFARALIGHGVGPETTVALLVPRGVDALVAVYAIAAAGGAYVMCDPGAPRERIATIVESVRPRLVLATGDLATRFGPLPALVLDPSVAEADALALASGPVAQHERTTPLRPDHPVYVVHTSGSTGAPKAVVATHRGLAALYRSHRRALHVPTQRRAGRDHLHVGHAWSLFFDAAWQPQLWMLSGHTVCLVDDDTRRDPARTVAQARAQGWDFVEVTPSHLAQLLDAGLVPDGGAPAALGFGGEAVAQPLWDRLRAMAPATESYNLYGPSESTVDSLVARVSDASAPVAGRAVAGTAVRVLDERLRPVPVGVVGELYVTGAGLARGYHGESGRTAERFVPDPYGDGARMYRTGDRVSWTADGAVRYRGRDDDQVKVRGYRVEPGEVAAALLAHRDVSDAVVVARDDMGVPVALAAYVVPASGRSVDGDELRAALAKVLPAYMIPSGFVVLDRLPTLANGKLDRRALPVPERHSGASYRAPVTDAERIVCRLVGDVAGVRVGLGDSVVDLGLDSMAVMRLVGAARREGLELDVADVFTTGSIELLAARAASADTASEIPNRTRGTR